MSVGGGGLLDHHVNDFGNGSIAIIFHDGECPKDIDEDTVASCINSMRAGGYIAFRQSSDGPLRPGT